PVVVRDHGFEGERARLHVAGGSHTAHLPFEGLAAEGVDADVHRLSRLQRGRLTLGHLAPELERTILHDPHDDCARPHVVPDAERAAGDGAAERPAARVPSQLLAGPSPPRPPPPPPATPP